MGEWLTKICVALWLCTAPSPSIEHAPAASIPGHQQTVAGQQAASSQRGTAAAPIVVRVLPAPEDQRKAEEEARDRRERAQLDRDLLKAATDLAGFTVRLAVATAALIAATIASALLAWMLTRRSHMTERAYVTIGGTCNRDPQGQEAYFIAHLGNFGRTPALVERLFVRVYSRDEKLAELPDYSHPAYQTYWGRCIDAGARSVDARIPPKRITGTANPAVYGRVWYTDMFKKKRSFGFIYHLDPDPLDPTAPAKWVTRPVDDPGLKRYAEWS